MRKKNKKMAMWILFVCVLFLGMYKIQAFAKFKQKSEYQISEELKRKEVKQLTFDEKKRSVSILLQHNYLFLRFRIKRR